MYTKAVKVQSQPANEERICQMQQDQALGPLRMNMLETPDFSLVLMQAILNAP